MFYVNLSTELLMQNAFSKVSTYNMHQNLPAFGKESDLLPATTLLTLVTEGQLSMRARNVCASWGLYTVQDVFNFVEEGNSFIKIRQCGLKTAVELENLVRTFAGDKAADLYFNSFGPVVCEKATEIFARRKFETTESQSLFELAYPSVAVFFNMMMNHPDGFAGAPKVHATSTEVAFQAVSVAVSLAENMLKAFKRVDGDDPSTLPFLMIDDIERNLAKIHQLVERDYRKIKIMRRLSDSKKKLLQRKYNVLLGRSTTIVSNYAKHLFPDCEDLVAVSQMEYEEFMRRYGSKRKSATGFYNSVLLPFNNYLLRLIDQPEDIRSIAKVDFPFLSGNELDFVAQFRRKYDYYPVFHIIYKYILSRNERDVEMFTLKHGIGPTLEKLELDEIGTRFRLTRERVRQITSIPLFLKDIDVYILDHIHVNYYDSTSLYVVFPISRWFTDLVRREKIPSSFGFVADVYCYYFDFKLAGRRKNLRLQRISTEETVDRLVEILIQKLAEKRPAVQYVDTRDILAQIEKPAGKSEDREKILTQILPGLKIGFYDGRVVFPKNVCKVEDEVIMMLEKAGKPLHIKHIIERLRYENPSLSLKDTTIKYILQHTEHIRPIGKSSHYALTRWENISTDSIRDIIRKILSESHTPVPLSEINKRVLVDYPWTNEKNIYANLSISKEFVMYGEGVFGLAGKNYPSSYRPVKGPKAHHTFHERLSDLRQFVANNKAMPCQGAPDPREASLSRWIDNALTRKIKIEDEYLEVLRRFIDMHKEIPQNCREKIFLANCKAFIAFVKKNHGHPGYKTCPSLYNWFIKNYHVYRNYNDNRTRYFENMLSKLKTTSPTTKK